MPKVTEKYKKEKQQLIINSAIEILKVKPIYDITMIDIIKVAGLSKGGIYLYFKDLDELLVEVINMIGREQSTIAFTTVIDTKCIEDSLVSIFVALGDYIESSPSLLGKIRFELMIYVSSHPEKKDTIMSKLQLQDIGTQFMENVALLIQKGFETSKFYSDIPIDIVMKNISAYIDGITEILVSATGYGGKPLQHPVRIYFQQFIQSLILFLKNK